MAQMNKNGIKLYIIYYILYIKYYYFLFFAFPIFPMSFGVLIIFDFAYILQIAKIRHSHNTKNNPRRPLPKILGYLDKSLQVIDLYKKKAILVQKTLRIALHTF